MLEHPKCHNCICKTCNNKMCNDGCPRRINAHNPCDHRTVHNCRIYWSDPEIPKDKIARFKVRHPFILINNRFKVNVKHGFLVNRFGKKGLVKALNLQPQDDIILDKPNENIFVRTVELYDKDTEYADHDKEDVHVIRNLEHELRDLGIRFPLKSYYSHTALEL